MPLAVVAQQRTGGQIKKGKKQNQDLCSPPVFVILQKTAAEYKSTHPMHRRLGSFEDLVLWMK